MDSILQYVPSSNANAHVFISIMKINKHIIILENYTSAAYSGFSSWGWDSCVCLPEGLRLGGTVINSQLQQTANT